MNSRDGDGIAGFPAHLWIAVAISLLQISFLLWRFTNWYIDDPFITYRYAWNLVHGAGFVYNVGERVLSTTTPLFTLILAGLGLIWQDIPMLATILGCIITGMSGLIFWDLARHWKLDIAAWAGLLLIPTFPLLASTIGSETPLYIALTLGVLNLYQRGRHCWMAFLAALLVLVRPDGFLLVLVIAALALWTKKLEYPLRILGIFLLTVAPWLIFAWIYFGSPIPATLMVKQQQGVMAISQLFAPGLITIALPYARRWYFILEAILAVIGLLWLLVHRHRALMLVLWSLSYFLAYTLLGVTRYFWYYAPLVPGFIMLVGAAFQFFKEFITHRNWLILNRLRIDRLLYLVLALLWVYQGINTYNMSLSPDKRYESYRAVGDWLRVNTAGDDRVGVLEVGIIGYYAQRPIVDFGGLIQPDVARQMRPDSTYNDTALWAINTYRPAYVVISTDASAVQLYNFVSSTCQVAQGFGNRVVNASSDIVIYNTDIVIYRCD